jgi:glutathione synthase/RimK-type ligase-like ATP-grasp enzyme
VRTLAIITGKCILSARRLAEAMNTRTHGEWQAKVIDIRRPGQMLGNIDHIFSYGCSEANQHVGHLINKREAIQRCVDKIKTFEVLLERGVPVPAWTKDKVIASAVWERIVVRSKVDGRKAEDLDYYFQGDVLPDAPLYTKYFEHKYEYRIVVFMGKVVGRYYKKEDGVDASGQPEWSFMVQPKRGFEAIDDACLKASEALGIDFVGFDIVAMDKQHFVVLEANSGPILTEEAETAIVEYYLNLEV